MDTKQIAAWFKANKVEVLGVGAAGVAGLALLQRKKAGPAGAGGVTAGAVAPGTIPAGSVVPASAYDSTSYDLYNALQDEIGTLARQNEAAGQTGAGGSGASAAVTPPIASTLYAPSGSGQYVAYSDGIYELEGDGSLLHLGGSQWKQIIAANGGKAPAYAGAFSGKAPTSYMTNTNLQNYINKANPNPNNRQPVEPNMRIF